MSPSVITSRVGESIYNTTLRQFYMVLKTLNTWFYYKRLQYRPGRVLLSSRSSSSPRCCDTLTATTRFEVGRCTVYPCRLTCWHTEPAQNNLRRVTEEWTFAIATATCVPGRGAQSWRPGSVVTAGHSRDGRARSWRPGTVVTAGLVALAVLPMIAAGIWAVGPGSSGCWP